VEEAVNLPGEPDDQEENFSDMDSRSIPDEEMIDDYAMHTIVGEFNY
jgi:hypothetical protein